MSPRGLLPQKATPQRQAVKAGQSNTQKQKELPKMGRQRTPNQKEMRSPQKEC